MVTKIPNIKGSRYYQSIYSLNGNLIVKYCLFNKAKSFSQSFDPSVTPHVKSNIFGSKKTHYIRLYLALKAGQTRRKLLLLQSVQDREEIGRIQKPLFCGNSTKLLIPWKSLLVKQQKPIQADGKTLGRISIGN